MKSGHYEKEVASYIKGFLLALGLTLLAYGVVVGRWVESAAMAAFVLLALGVVQLVCQAVYFLHLDSEKRPHWKAQSFVFTALMVVVIVVGSLWIMHNLNYHMNLTAEEMIRYMLEQNKKGF